jgi:hypothetical protein
METALIPMGNNVDQTSSAAPRGGATGVVAAGSAETRGLPSGVFSGACKWLCCASCSSRGGRGEQWGLPFPRTAEELQSLGVEWVTRALRTSRAITPSNSCRSLGVQPLGESGLLGEMVLVRWEFEEEVSFPLEVVAKFTPQNNWKLQLLATAMGFFAAEYHYYKFCSERSGLPGGVPRLIFGDFHYRSARFVLFLEKIDGTRNFLQDTSTKDEREQMIRALAAFHAVHLGRTGARSVAWAPRIEDGSQKFFETLVSPWSSWLHGVP